MDKQYIELFKRLAQLTEVSAERVMELNKEKQDEKGYKTASVMRDDYAKLYDNLSNENYQLTYNDFSKLLVGAYIASSQLEDRIKVEQKVLDGYKIDTLPKLQRIIDENKINDNEGALKLADEIFQVIDKEK